MRHNLKTMSEWWTQTGEATWSKMDNPTLPEVPESIMAKYRKYKTKYDLCDDPPKLYSSPTCSSVCTDAHDDPTVFVDSQDVIWFRLDDDGKVICLYDIVVAGSLAEFLARMDLDNRAWYILDSTKRIPKDWVVVAKEPEGVIEYVTAMYQSQRL